MPTVINGIKFYRVKEVAQILQLSELTIRKYFKDGKLKGQRIGLPVYITEKSLNEFLTPSLGEADKKE